MALDLSSSSRKFQKDAFPEVNSDNRGEYLHNDELKKYVSKILI